jgi:hypothetical protein
MSLHGHTVAADPRREKARMHVGWVLLGAVQLVAVAAASAVARLLLWTRGWPTGVSCSWLCSMYRVVTLSGNSNIQVELKLSFDSLIEIFMIEGVQAFVTLPVVSLSIRACR